jgi:DNA polymerase elongation subunit (family B)
MTKEDYWYNEHDFPVPQKMFVPREETEEVEHEYKDHFLNLAKLAGSEDWFWSTIKSRDFSSLKTILDDPRFHGADIHIEDHYTARYIDHYSQSPDDNLIIAPKLHKAYWDIEAMTRKAPPGTNIEEWTREASIPIDAISVYSDKEDTMYTFLLRDPENPLCKEFEDNLEFHKNKCISDLEITDCEIMFFDEEIDLLSTFFHVLNENLKPDYLSAWNLAFDFKMTYNRIKVLGYEPKDFFCTEDMPKKVLYYYEDKDEWDRAKKSDYATVASSINYVDQMLIFAALRATMGKRDSYKLDDILLEELGKQKDEVIGNFRTFAMTDYAKYVYYNQKDVFRLHELEDQNTETDLIYRLSNITRTRSQKAWKKTISLRNLANKFMLDRGFVCSNNHNTTYDGGDNKKFEGAFVASPDKNDYNGIKIFGSRSNKIYENVCDFDLTSLYPSILLLQMIDPTNQFGRINIRDENDKDLSPKFIRDFTSGDMIRFGENWLGLPGKDELIELFS